MTPRGGRQVNCLARTIPDSKSMEAARGTAIESWIRFQARCETGQLKKICVSVFTSPHLGQVEFLKIPRRKRFSPKSIALLKIDQRKTLSFANIPPPNVLFPVKTQGMLLDHLDRDRRSCLVIPRLYIIDT